jgi:paraquat-inducible protein B
MSRKTNNTAIGAFVAGALILFIAAIVVFGSGKFFKQSDKYVLFFDGSIKGLSDGAPVIFRGVKIGNVSSIGLEVNPKTKDVLIPVVIDVELSRVEGVPDKLGYPDYKQLIDRGLRGRLEIQTFITGQLMIAFDFYPDKPAVIQDIVTKYPKLPVLPISPDIFELMDELPIKEISSNLEETVAGINKIVNSGDLQQGFYELNNMLREATQTARSLRYLAEYLEQHPEAFLKGKPAPGGDLR